MNDACRANLVPTGRQPDSENDSNFPPGPPMTLGNMRGFNANLRRNLWFALWLAALNLALAFVLFLMLR